MKNKLTDLNNHLFAQLERLGDEDLVGEKLQEEIKRSAAISSIAKDVVNNATLVLKAQKCVWDRVVDGEMPKMLQAE